MTTHNPIGILELAHNLEAAGLYQLTTQEYLDLPRHTLRQLTAACAAPCPACNATGRTVPIPFGRPDSDEIQHWLRCNNCYHTHRYN